MVVMVTGLPEITGIVLSQQEELKFPPTLWLFLTGAFAVVYY